MALSASAQYYIASFDTLHLSQPDTFYVNYAMPMHDVGFNDGGAHFPCFYDTSWGGTWVNGFAYSNMTDSVTSGLSNQYSAKTAKGYGNSANYAVALYSQDTSHPTRITFAPVSPDSVMGFYVTNTTYAYNSMRDGDAFAKKFGGITGNDPDWFRLTIKGYHNGILKPDSVNFYLADFRDNNNANDYIIRNWTWVDLLPLGNVDSLKFILNSSDTGAYGMNTPAYFCMDNMVIKINPIHVNELNRTAFAAKVYPNPATDMLYVDLADQNITTISVLDASGKQVYSQSVNGKQVQINTAALNAGVYFVQMKAGDKTATARFIKQ